MVFGSGKAQAASQLTGPKIEPDSYTNRKCHAGYDAHTHNLQGPPDYDCAADLDQRARQAAD